jgi:hypothetical protein
MVMPRSGCYHYDTVLQAKADGTLGGIAEDDGGESLFGTQPSVIVTGGRVTLIRRNRGLARSQPSHGVFEGGQALTAVLRQGDRLACWRDGCAELGLSVTRGGSMVLAVGSLGRTPCNGVIIDEDPRVEETELALEVRSADRQGARVVWLDPERPDDVEAQLRKLGRDLAGVRILVIVMRTDDYDVRTELTRRASNVRGNVSTKYITAAQRFSSLEEWLQYGRSLQTGRPADLWLRVRSGDCESCVPQGTTGAVDRWLVHVRRVYEWGVPGYPSQLGIVATGAGVTAEMLEHSTAAIARGLHFS